MRIFGLLFLLVFLSGVLCGKAFADEETCQTWAEEAYHAADARDNGWPEAKLKEMLDVPRRAGMANENYWQFRLIIDTVFRNPDKSAAEIERMLLQDCLNKLNVPGDA